MPLTLLAPALVAILAAAEPPDPAWTTPADAATDAPTEAATEPATAAPTAPAYTGSPPRTTSGDWTVTAGWGTTGLMGVVASGVQLAIEHAPRRTFESRVMPVRTVELFVGETRPGLAIRSCALGMEGWYGAGRLQAGGGFGLGVIAYRRATGAEWPFLLTAGLRAGAELALFRLGDGELVVGAHGTASLGPWLSASVVLGYRGGAGSP